MPELASPALFEAAHAGDEAALGRLYGLFYDTLRGVARGQIARSPDATLQATELVHEAYQKMAGRPLDLQGGGHLVGIAARAMRQVLVDHARSRAADKRGGGLGRTTLASRHCGVSFPLDDLLTLDTALDRLDALSPRLRQTVELRFFGGLSEEETAEVLGCTTRTVRRDWTKARLFLHHELSSFAP